ncbi:hypothetical protein J6590_000907 [Homalodisca vitripennis]|nr:hypothetical protein J6590_000907 [Homalodisca vitripennis]
MALVSLAYADPIYYSAKGVAQLPAAARVASPSWYAGAYATPTAAAAPGLSVDVASEDTLILNAAAKGLALDQAGISAPSSSSPASYVPAIQAFAPAATRVYTAADLSALDAAASGFPVAIEAVDALTGAAKTIAISQANVGAASSRSSYLNSVMADAPVTFPSDPAVTMTKFSLAATGALAPAGAAAKHALNAAAPMAWFAPAAPRVLTPAGAAAKHALNAAAPMAWFAPAATRAFTSAGAAAKHALNADAPMAWFAPAATRAFTPAGAAAKHALNADAPMAWFAPAAPRVITPAGAAAKHALNADAPMAWFAPAAPRVITSAGAAAKHALNANAPMAWFAPAATRAFTPAGAAAKHAINAAAPMAWFAPASTRAFTPVGAAATHAIHALGPDANRVSAPAVDAAAPTVYLSDSDAYKAKHHSQIAEVLLY